MAHDHEMVIRCRSCGDNNEIADINSVVIFNNGKLSIACQLCKQFITSFDVDNEKLDGQMKHNHVMVRSKHIESPKEALELICPRCASHTRPDTMRRGWLRTSILQTGHLKFECIVCNYRLPYAIEVDTSHLPPEFWICEECGEKA